MESENFLEFCLKCANPFADCLSSRRLPGEPGSLVELGKTPRDVFPRDELRLMHAPGKAICS